MAPGGDGQGGNVWQDSGREIWQEEDPARLSAFYPVYRWGDLYSYSPWALIREKGYVRLNPLTEEAVRRPGFRYLQPHEFIDLDIERIGGPLSYRREIREPQRFASMMAEAMAADIRDAERANPGTTNVIMTGGKDSMNLLLLPWSHPTVVASGPPNCQLVKEFMERNGLVYPLIELRDMDAPVRDEHILANCCRSNLAHLRWTEDLCRIAKDYEYRAVFWAGHLGDTFLTPYWKTYRPHESKKRGRIAKRVDRYAPFVRGSLVRAATRAGWTQRAFFKALWERGAMWQGTNMGLRREMTGCPWMSGYHGPEVTDVLSRTDMLRCVREDVRPKIGSILKGGAAWYPSENPGPPKSESQEGLASVERWVELARAAGIEIQRAERGAG